MVLTVLTIQMQKLRKQPHLQHKDTLKLQVDGGSENWNFTLIGLMAIWIHRGVLKCFIANKMFPHHGHNDGDGLGSTPAKHINGSSDTLGMNCLTWDSTMDAIVESYIQHAVDASPYPHSFNFDEFVRPHLHPQLEGSAIGNMKRTIQEVEAGALRKASMKAIELRAGPDGHVRLKYKLHMADKEFLGKAPTSAVSAVATSKCSECSGHKCSGHRCSGHSGHGSNRCNGNRCNGHSWHGGHR